MMIVENTLKTNNSIEDKNQRNDSTGDFIQGANINYDYNSSVSQKIWQNRRFFKLRRENKRN